MVDAALWLRHEISFWSWKELDIQDDLSNRLILR